MPLNQITQLQIFDLVGQGFGHYRIEALLGNGLGFGSCEPVSTACLAAIGGLNLRLLHALALLPVTEAGHAFDLGLAGSLAVQTVYGSLDFGIFRSAILGQIVMKLSLASTDLAGDDQVAGTFAGATIFDDLFSLEQKDFAGAGTACTLVGDVGRDAEEALRRCGHLAFHLIFDQNVSRLEEISGGFLSSGKEFVERLDHDFGCDLLPCQVEDINAIERLNYLLLGHNSSPSIVS